MIRDERGGAFVETLIAFPCVLFTFLGVYMMIYMYAADLIVERAASAAARAASVYLADSASLFPSDEVRMSYVREAARRVLFASPVLDANSVEVEVAGDRSGWSELTASVHADFDCAVFLVPVICGLDGKARISASSPMIFQGP